MKALLFKLISLFKRQPADSIVALVFEDGDIKR